MFMGTFQIPFFRYLIKYTLMTYQHHHQEEWRPRMDTILLYCKYIQINQFLLMQPNNNQLKL